MWHDPDVLIIVVVFVCLFYFKGMSGASFSYIVDVIPDGFVCARSG